MLTKSRKDSVKEYRRFVAIESDEEIAGVLERKKWPSILGPETFIDWVKGKYYTLKADQEVPQAKDLAPETDLIINAVCKWWRIGTSRNVLTGPLMGDPIMTPLQNR